MCSMWSSYWPWQKKLRCPYLRKFWETRNQKNWDKQRTHTYSREGNRRITIGELSEDVQISCGSVQSIITEYLCMRMRRPSLCQNSKQLLDDQKETRVCTRSSLLCGERWKLCVGLIPGVAKLFDKLDTGSLLNFPYHSQCHDHTSTRLRPKRYCG